MIGVVYKFKNAFIDHILIEIYRNPMAMVHVIARTNGFEFSLQQHRYVGRLFEITEVERFDIDKTKPLIADGEDQQVAVVFTRCLVERHLFCYAFQRRAMVAKRFYIQ